MKVIRPQMELEIKRKADILVVGGGPAGIGRRSAQQGLGKRYFFWKREVFWEEISRPVMWKTAIIF